MRIAAKEKPSHPILWTFAPAGGRFRTNVRGARTLPGGSDKEVVTVRVLVVVLLGLVVVLAILTELCLLQAASMRRKIRAALPPEDQEGR
jgi:hypothetical protein